MKNILKFGYSAFTILLALPVYAQTDTPPSFSGDGGLGEVVDKVLGYLFPFAGLIALIFIIQGGYMWIMSAGDPAKIKQAQGTLTWAILGLIFVMIILSLLSALIEFIAK